MRVNFIIKYSSFFSFSLVAQIRPLFCPIALFTLTKFVSFSPIYVVAPWKRYRIQSLSSTTNCIIFPRAVCKTLKKRKSHRCCIAVVAMMGISRKEKGRLKCHERGNLNLNLIPSLEPHTHATVLAAPPPHQLHKPNASMLCNYYYNSSMWHLELHPQILHYCWYLRLRAPVL